MGSHFAFIGALLEAFALPTSSSRQKVSLCARIKPVYPNSNSTVYGDTGPPFFLFPFTCLKKGRSPIHTKTRASKIIVCVRKIAMETIFKVASPFKLRSRVFVGLPCVQTAGRKDGALSLLTLLFAYNDLIVVKAVDCLTKTTSSSGHRLPLGKVISCRANLTGIEDLKEAWWPLWSSDLWWTSWMMHISLAMRKMRIHLQVRKTLTLCPLKYCNPVPICGIGMIPF
jgi:hypothetical protein